MTKILAALLLLMGVTHVVALWNSWYFTYPWIDIPLHFAGGAFAAVLFFWLFGAKINALPYMAQLVLALSFTALIGVLWEFFEFLFDVFVSSKGYAYVAQISAADTISDLFVDLVGGLSVWILKNSYYIADKDNNN